MQSKEQIAKSKLEREALGMYLESLDSKKKSNIIKGIDNKHLAERQRKLRRLIVK